MASSAEYLEYVLDLLRDVPEISHKKMMGEYLLYSEDVLFGGIYDDRFLLKDTPAARAAFPEEQIPYDGAKHMILVDIEDSVRIAEVVSGMLAELPKPKNKR
ncbi:MAG: TfoX/Sxy family protein [bacterium]|nr:TfoX/Sxy family protein [bacterium]